MGVVQPLELQPLADRRSRTYDLRAGMITPL
jgi:hypothetical protein